MTACLASKSLNPSCSLFVPRFIDPNRCMAKIRHAVPCCALEGGESLMNRQIVKLLTICMAATAFAAGCGNGTQPPIQCTADRECTSSAQPVCVSGKCVECRDATTCPTSMCRSDNTCVPAAEVVFVDNKNTACAATSQAGTIADPFCSIQTAVEKLGGKKYIRVEPTMTPYGPIDMDGISVTIIGKGNAFGGGAIIEGSAIAGVLCRGSSDVTIEGVEVRSSTKPGLSCTGGSARLTIRNSYIHDTKPGVEGTDCASLVVDSSSISQNISGGISMNKTTYSITNNFIVDNFGRGVTMDDVSTGVFAFNTVARNIVNGGAAGLYCGIGDPKTIESSIFVENVQATTMNMPIAGACTLKNVIVGMSDAMYTGAKNAAPVFKSMTDYHLPNVSANQDCCIDKGGTGTDHDIDFEKRPTGAALDIGADEVQ